MSSSWLTLEVVQSAGRPMAMWAGGRWVVQSNDNDSNQRLVDKAHLVRQHAVGDRQVVVEDHLLPFSFTSTSTSLHPHLSLGGVSTY